MHEAFAAALESWPKAGIPDKPRPWLIFHRRFKASLWNREQIAEGCRFFIYRTTIG
jgi:predicted RNA polymerase sigma factor